MLTIFEEHYHIYLCIGSIWGIKHSVYTCCLLVSDVALNIIPGTNDMDGIIFTESFSFRNWTVSPTPPSKKKSILDEFPSSQQLLFMTTAFLSRVICFAYGQIQGLDKFNIFTLIIPIYSFVLFINLSMHVYLLNGHAYLLNITRLHI